MSADLLQPGTVVADQYRIERLIGSGGFARVYRAVEIELERPVALKILTPSTHQGLMSHDSVRKRFNREARLLSKLQDPRTVTIYEYDVLADGQLYMALEYIDGVNLASLIRNEGALEPERIRHLLIQILLGLRAAHRHGMLHRDIKPSNVMVYDRYGEPDCVKLLDFGIAKAVMVEAEHAMAQDLTMEGAVVGTPRYMSPEQLLGRPLAAASDLFSTGLMLYEMFTGSSPFETHDRTEIFRRMQGFEQNLGALEQAPTPLLEVARGLLAPSLEQRYASAEEVLDVLLGEPQTAKPAAREVARKVASIHPGAGQAGASSPAGHAAPRASLSSAGSPASAPRAASAITFPLGFDPAGATPSTELTSIDLVDERTAQLNVSEAEFRADRARRRSLVEAGQLDSSSQLDGSGQLDGSDQFHRPGDLGDSGPALQVETPAYKRPENEQISTQSLEAVELDVMKNSSKAWVWIIVAVLAALAAWAAVEFLTHSDTPASDTPAKPAVDKQGSPEASASSAQPTTAVAVDAAVESVRAGREQANQAARRAAQERALPAQDDQSGASEPRRRRRARPKPVKKERPSSTSRPAKSARPAQRGGQDQAGQRKRSREQDEPDNPSFEIKAFE